MYHTTQTQICIFPSFDLVTLHDLDLSRGYQGLRGVSRNISDTINAVPLAIFQLDTAASPGKSSDDRKQTNLTFDLTSDVTSDLKINFVINSERCRSCPWQSNTIFGSRTGVVVWQIARWGAVCGQVSEISPGARVKSDVRRMHFCWEMLSLGHWPGTAPPIRTWVQLSTQLYVILINSHLNFLTPLAAPDIC